MGKKQLFSQRLKGAAPVVESEKLATEPEGENQEAETGRTVSVSPDSTATSNPPVQPPESKEKKVEPFQNVLDALPTEDHRRKLLQFTQTKRITLEAAVAGVLCGVLDQKSIDRFIPMMDTNRMTFGVAEGTTCEGCGQLFRTRDYGKRFCCNHCAYRANGTADVEGHSENCALGHYTESAAA